MDEMKDDPADATKAAIVENYQHGVHQAPLDFIDPLETWRDAPPRCALCSAVDADGGARWEGMRYLCRECYEKSKA